MSHIDGLQPLSAAAGAGRVAAIHAALGIPVPETEQGWIASARAAAETGRMDDRDALLEAAVRRFPKSLALAKDYAASATRRGQADQAVSRWQACAPHFPDQPSVRAGLCAALLAARRLEEAEEALGEAIARFPKDVALRLDHARCAEMRRLPEEAYGRWQTAISLFPDNAPCIVGTAMALCNLRKTDEAETMLADALQRFPQHPQILSAAAFVAQIRRNWPSALQRAQSLIDVIPDRAAGYETRIMALRELGRTEEAEAELAIARKKFPDSTKLATEEIRLSSARGDASAALAAWQQARRQNQAPALSVSEISDLLVRHGKCDEAEILLKEELDRYSQAASLAVRYGMMAARRKNWPEAAARWRALDAQFPGNTQILGGLAEAVWMMRDEETLVKLLDQIIAIEPNNITAAILYARLEMRHNRAADAVQRLLAAEKAWPGHRNILAQLNDARMQALTEGAELAPGAATAPTQAVAHGQPGESLFADFESLGSGCEFGLLQRHTGCEPIGLLRWANITPRGLTEALERRFEGVGDVTTSCLIESGDTYLLADRPYRISMQTFISPATEAAETLLPKLCRRQRYLAGLLMENLREARRILVYKLIDTMTEADILRLWAAVKSYGESPLLIVRAADEAHPAGSFWSSEPGLMMGTVSGFSNTGADVSSWIKICTAARAEWASLKRER